MIQCAMAGDVAFKDDSIEIKQEEEGADRVEILDFSRHTFLCTICGKTHSKNLSCVGYGIFKTEIFLCSNIECGKTFESEIELEQHADSCKVDTKPLDETATDQDEDLYLHRPEVKQCNYCQKKFKTKESYLQHMRIFHPDLIKCKVVRCNTFFRRQADFEGHKMKDHKNLVFCAFCGKDYRSKLTVQSHLFSDHLQKKASRSKKCNSISGQNYRKTTLKDSLCTFCWKDIPWRQMETHKNTICNKCEKSFHCKGLLAQHKPTCFFQCIVCNKKFKENRNLVCHAKTHKIVWKDSKYKSSGLKCDECRRYFQQKWALNKHVRRVHSKNSKLTCDICKKIFASKFNITRHIIRVHKFGTKTFKCERCSKKFYLFENLKDHDNVVHGDLIECNNCGKVIKKYNFENRHSKLCVKKQK